MLYAYKSHFPPSCQAADRSALLLDLLGASLSVPGVGLLLRAALHLVRGDGVPLQLLPVLHAGEEIYIVNIINHTITCYDEDDGYLALFLLLIVFVRLLVLLGLGVVALALVAVLLALL